MTHLQQLLGLLRALHWLQWTAHWVAKGESFQGDHDLFAALYQSLPDEIDALAEKMVAMSPRPLETVDPSQSMAVAQTWLQRWGEPSVASALKAERDLQQVLLQVYSHLETTHLKTLGMDDFLMSLADTHETALYKLQQRSRKTAKKTKGMSAESFFFDTPRKKDVREFAQSKATSNVPDVAKDAVQETENRTDTVRSEMAKVNKTPLTPTEVIEETPGAEVFSTLSRYVVQTEEPVSPLVPQGVEEVPKHPKLAQLYWGL